ncbi:MULTISPECIES: hypothetical protein [Streptomyces]|uniref:hypothetical protein n=1 Tax=Streptomyces TaxID=1883 RepID=UPI00073DB767|nr:hypothetical protein [Streptomyces sp. FBKL.4005]MYU28610.1 hypothetical protein [Streptomyces sp. SID7810]OYP17010.1 hypothetical protein CFC35_22955 [Streptomyces sp. FBKL.4005]CUW29648.1 hypothetical protein TUE45_04357 [Streptomyces reticuli]
MTGKATTQTPTRPDPPATDLALPEAEFRRWTPEEVIEMRLLPYRSARVLKQKCYKREIFHHRDGGRITFTAEDLRKENARTAVEPFAKAAV